MATIEDFWRAMAEFWDSESGLPKSRNPYARLVRRAERTGDWPIWWDPDEEAR